MIVLLIDAVLLEEIVRGLQVQGSGKGVGGTPYMPRSMNRVS